MIVEIQIRFGSVQVKVIRPKFGLSRSDHRRTQGSMVPCPLPLWPCNKMQKPNFQSKISQSNNGCSLLSLILAKLLLSDKNCENIFALSIVTALTAHPFALKKCARMGVFFYVKTVKVRWQLGATPPDPLSLRRLEPLSHRLYPLFCQILSAPLESDCHMSEHFVFV